MIGGPALVICPECGAEIGREMLHTGLKVYVLPHPRTCPECDALLNPRVRPAPDRCQAHLGA
jgi:RNA polymerase-binding transcription factor DksA